MMRMRGRYRYEEELENLDLSEGMDTGENADDGSLR